MSLTAGTWTIAEGVTTAPVVIAALAVLVADASGREARPAHRATEAVGDLRPPLPSKRRGLSQMVVLAAVSRNPRRSGRIGVYWRGHQRPRSRRSIASVSTVGAPPLRRHSMPVHLLFHVASSRSSNTTPR